MKLENHLFVSSNSAENKEISRKLEVEQLTLILHSKTEPCRLFVESASKLGSIIRFPSPKRTDSVSVIFRSFVNSIHAPVIINCKVCLSACG